MAEHIIYKLGPFQIPDLGARRFVRVYVPPGGERRASPLLCMFDGQNVFHDEPSFSGGWHLHETARAMAEQGMVAPVVVGIDHGGESRIHGLSPFKTSESEGRLDEVLGWMLAEVLPRVRATFEVLPGVESTFIGGSSLGGLAALCAHIRHPEVFGGALAMSPSFWLGSGAINKYLDEHPRPLHSRIYIDAGGREGGGSVAARAEEVVAHLRTKGYDDASLRYVLDPEADHNEAAWRHRARGALEFLMKDVAAARAQRESQDAHGRAA